MHDIGNRQMSEKRDNTEDMIKRSMMEAAGLDPDSELAKQPLEVILKEIQRVSMERMMGLQTGGPLSTSAAPPKESSAPKKDKIHVETPVTEAKSASGSKTGDNLETRIQNQYQASLTEILGLWDKSIKLQKSNLDQVCGFLNVQKYGLGEELSGYVNWATKATNEGISETEFNKELKKRAESLQKLLDTTLSADKNLAKKADKLKEQIQRLCTMAKDDHLKMDELSKKMVTHFEKLGGEI
jgi:hypothetical protein